MKEMADEKLINRFLEMTPEALAELSLPQLKLNAAKRLLICRVFRPEILPECLLAVVKNEMGPEFSQKAYYCLE